MADPHSSPDVTIAPLSAARLLNVADRHHSFARILGILAVVFVLVLFLPWQQNVQGKGVVTALRPQDRPQVVPTVIAGRIARWHVAEGEYVKAGALLVEITEVKESYLDPNTLQRYQEVLAGKEASVSAKRAKVEALQRQVAALEQSRDFSILKGRNKVAQYEAAVNAAVTDSVVAERQLARNQQLFDEGLKSRTDLESYITKAQSVNAKLVEKRQELQSARVELEAYGAEYAEKIAKAMSDMSATRSEIGEGPARFRSWRTRSPRWRFATGCIASQHRRTAMSCARSRPGLANSSRKGIPSSPSCRGTRSRRWSCTCVPWTSRSCARGARCACSSTAGPRCSSPGGPASP